jgi:putative SOS response-associated peptidase YedK
MCGRYASFLSAEAMARLFHTVTPIRNIPPTWDMAPRRGKQPYAIAWQDGQPIAFAGLWEGFRWPDGKVTPSFTIVTTNANDTVGELYDRMPAILAPQDWPLWLGEVVGDPATMLKPASEDVLKVRLVSKRVNSPRNNEAELLERVG